LEVEKELLKKETKIAELQKMLLDAATKDEKIEDLQLTILELQGVLASGTQTDTPENIQPDSPNKNIHEANEEG
jgi:hypothetical protein